MKVETGNPVITIGKNNQFSDAVKKVTSSLSGIFKSIKGVFNSTLNINTKKINPITKKPLGFIMTLN